MHVSHPMFYNQKHYNYTIHHYCLLQDLALTTCIYTHFLIPVIFFTFFRLLTGESLVCATLCQKSYRQHYNPHAFRIITKHIEGKIHTALNIHVIQSRVTISQHL